MGPFTVRCGKGAPKIKARVRESVRICEEHLSGDYCLKVMDVSETPEVAATEQILALPTVVRRQPKPTRRIIGDLGDTDRILISLGVKAMSSSMLSA